MRSYTADTCVGIVASPSTGSAMPPADLISAASVRVKSAVLATSATRYPCARLRRPAPVAWIEPPGKLPFCAITRYEDCGAILRAHRRFVIAPRLGVFPEEQAPTDAPPFRHLLNMDPPEHGRYRNLLSQQFTPKALESKRAAVGGTGDERPAPVAERAQGG